MAQDSKPRSPSSPSFLRLIAQAGVIIAASLWVFWPLLHADWLPEDTFYVTYNPLLQDPHRLWKAWLQPGTFIEYYPIQQTVQWIQWRLFGTDPFGYHATNLFLHLVNSLLLWKLFDKLGLRLAWIGGLLFALHPVQVESIAWIAELKNTLSLAPFLLTMCAWIDYEKHRRITDYAFALGWFLIAMLCKISMATFPFIILLYAWWRRDRIVLNDLKVSAPFFVISLVLGVTNLLVGEWFAHHSYFSLSMTTPDLALPSRLALAGTTFTVYFAKVFWPPLVQPLFPQWTVSPPSLLQFLLWPTWLAAAFWLWTKRNGWGRHVLLGLGFFTLTMLPFLGFNMVSYMNTTWVFDHLLYIPIIGLIGIAIAGLDRLSDLLAPIPHLLRASGLALLLLVLAFTSHAYAEKFVNADTLFGYAVERNPTSWHAYYALGNSALAHGRAAQAIRDDEIALKLRPDSSEAWGDLGLALAESGRTSEAIAAYEKSLQLHALNPEVHYNLGKVLHRTGHLTEAIEQFQQTLQINPNDANAHSNLGTCLQEYGHPQEALTEFAQALRLNPRLAEAHNNLGIALAKLGRWPEAQTQFDITLQLDPTNPQAQANLQQLKSLQQTHPGQK